VGDPSRAEQASRAGVALLEEVTQRDPANLYWRMRSLFQRLMLLDVLLALGRRDEVSARWPSIHDDGGALLQRADAADRDRQLRLAGALLLKRQLLDPNVTEADFDAYLASNREFMDRGRLADTGTRHLLAMVLIAAGDQSHSAGHPEAARRHWQTASDLLAPPLTGDVAPLLTQLAHARLRLGDLAGAQALAERVAATAYRHPAQADLVQRLAAAGRGVPVKTPHQGRKP
jgi:hypothetical protein